MEIENGGILIIAGPRTGGTNLMKSIGSAYNKPTRFEYDIVNKHLYYDSNIDVVKFVPMWKDYFRRDLETSYKKILENSKKFNTIILLNRKDKLKQLESIYVQQAYEKYKVDVKWGSEKHIDTTTKLYSYLREILTHVDSCINFLSKDLNIPIDYYEDVYINKSLTNKNIKLDLEYFEPKYKLKQEIKLKRLV